MVVNTAKEAAIGGVAKSNPVAGAALSKVNEKREASKAKRKEKVQQQKAAEQPTPSPSSKKTGQAKSKTGPSIGGKFSAKIGNKNLLLAELIICLTILVFGTVVAPKGSDNGVHRMMIKGSALMAVFFILAILSAGGTGPKKIASALGLLITLSYVLTSSDIRNVMSWSTGFFTTANEEKIPATAEASKTSTTVPPPPLTYA